MNRVEVMYFDGCPNVEIATDHAREAVAAAGVLAEVRLVRIDGNTEAMRRQFLGSPTVRVNGEDVDVSARDRMDLGLQCRVYKVDSKLVGMPPVAWIEAALRGDAKGRAEVPRSATCCSVDATNTRRR
jgi:hypothetical protein